MYRHDNRPTQNTLLDVGPALVSFRVWPLEAWSTTDKTTAAVVSIFWHIIATTTLTPAFGRRQFSYWDSITWWLV